MTTDLKIAYIISAYKYPQQLIRLVERLDTKDTHFLIHVDKKTSHDLYQEMVAGLAQKSNVYFLKRHRCYWGDFGHVRASIKGIRELFAQNISFDYVKLLTGQDYPIKSNEEIKAYLTNHQFKSFANYTALPNPGWIYGGMNRFEKVHLRPFGKHFWLPYIRRKPPQGMKVFGGSPYWCFSFEVARYVNQFIEQNPGYVNYFNYVEIPDELFFQTIIMNSSYAKQLVNSDLTDIIWVYPRPNPEILQTIHFDQLAHSENLFARKFDTTQDTEILNLIDKHLL